MVHIIHELNEPTIKKQKKISAPFIVDSWDCGFWRRNNWKILNVQHCFLHNPQLNHQSAICTLSPWVQAPLTFLRVHWHWSTLIVFLSHRYFTQPTPGQQTRDYRKREHVHMHHLRTWGCKKDLPTTDMASVSKNSCRVVLRSLPPMAKSKGLGDSSPSRWLIILLKASLFTLVGTAWVQHKLR